MEGGEMSDTANKIWALREAAKPGGFVPNHAYPL